MIENTAEIKARSKNKFPLSKKGSYFLSFTKRKKLFFDILPKMKLNVHILLFCFMLIGEPTLWAQSPSSLRKLTPSYSEDFYHYKSNLALCVQDVFFDDNGKMWLNLCNYVNTLNLHLLQFDGYAFQMVQGDLKKLGADSRIQGMLDGHTLIGFTIDKRENHIFRYDLQTNKVRFDYPPKKGKVKFLTVKENGQVFFLLIAESEWTMYEMADTQFIEHERIKVAYRQTTEKGETRPTHPRFFDGDYLWISPPDLSFFERIDLNTGHREKYDLPVLPYKKLPSNRHPVLNDLNITEVNGITYLSLMLRGRYYFMQATTGEKRFTHVEEDKSINQTRKYWDEQGNSLTVYTYSKKKHQAILEDKDGNRFDYSAFFEPLKGGHFHRVVSSDFKQQLIICNVNGILLHKVKSFDAIQNFLPEANARAIAEVGEQQYLVTTESPYRFIINKKTNQTYPIETPDCHYQERTLIRDDEGNIWAAGTKDGLIKFNPFTNTCQKIPTDGKRIQFYFTFISPSQIAMLARDKHLYIHDLQSGKTTPFLVDGEPLVLSVNVQDMLYRQDGLLWVATVKGLYKIDLKAGIVEVLGHEAPFDSARFLCIEEDAEGRFWLGTSLNGLQIYDPKTQELKTLNGDKGLANNTVVSITPDEDGDKWLGTYNGVSLVSSEGDLITNLYVEDGVVFRESNRYSNLKTADGKILIGTLNGISLIDPKAIKEKLDSKKELKIYLTALEHFDSKTNELKKQIYGLKNTEFIHLPAAHRNLKLHFAVSNYFKPEENKYAYRLNGEDWTELGNQPYLHLNNLPAGKHRLSIRGGDKLGNWTEESLVIDIDAAEFFYKQTWFFLLCLFMIGSLVALWINSLRTEVKRATKKIREDKETIERQAEKLKELDQAKSKFFTNISHEFRTPLTIISGMIDQVMAKPDVWVEKGGKMIKQNTLSLLNLINQILDLRKLESQKMTLNLVQGDIVKYLRYLTESYQSYAANKGMKLHFLAAQPSITMDYDPDKMLRIVSNLLSNAIKYNKEYGNVYFQVEQIEKDGKDHLQMRVQDTGKGIPKEKLQEIFSRFYQINEPGKTKVTGSGIGLALTHELVNLMNGTIEANSEVNVGTTLRIKIPITRIAEVKESFVETPAVKQEISTQHDTIPSMETQPHVLTKNGEKAANLPNLLIVEDNPEIVQILIACLEDEYHLQVANNGQQGIDMAIEQVPDLIVSDVMMPEKDGFELTDALKKDERTSHIPIILLTAKSDLDSKISGLEKGADAYLAKPFEQKELLVRLRKLLELRKLLQVRYSGSNPSTVNQSPSSNLKLEDRFMQKVRNVVHENMEDENFGTVGLCTKLRMSRTQVHNKIKALTGKSTSIYIRSMRLQKAKDLLETTDLNVSEVGYEVGFRNPAYFSRVFSEEFGISPDRTRK